MTRKLLLLAVLAALASGAGGGTGMAQSSSPPACTESREGAVACIAGKLCACRFQRGGSMTGRPDGHRWDCGALRPACGAEANPPATLSQPYPIPPPQILIEPQLRRPSPSPLER